MALCHCLFYRTSTSTSGKISPGWSFTECHNVLTWIFTKIFSLHKDSLWCGSHDILHRFQQHFCCGMCKTLFGFSYYRMSEHKSIFWVSQVGCPNEFFIEIILHTPQWPQQSLPCAENLVGWLNCILIGYATWFINKARWTIWLYQKYTFLRADHIRFWRKLGQNLLAKLAILLVPDHSVTVNVKFWENLVNIMLLTQLMSYCLMAPSH